MSIEIERKFLITNDGWKSLVINSFFIKQGYLNLAPERTVRVRIKGSQAHITIKGKSKGISRAEFEYQIPLKEAEQLILLSEGALIEKVRHEVKYEGNLWEIDVFSGKNQGLIVAEIELASENQIFKIPDWIGKEVSDDTKYYNSNLVISPFLAW